jgi:hypothetical protein
MGFPADNPARPPPTLVSEICRLDLQLLEMQCSRPPTLTLQRASYPRIKHFDIFPPFFRDLSQEPSFCICGWKLVSNQEWIAGFRFLLRSPRRKLPFVPALNLFLASVQNQPFSSFRQELCRSWCARPPDLFSLTCKLDLYFVPRHTTSCNLQTDKDNWRTAIFARLWCSVFQVLSSRPFCHHTSLSGSLGSFVGTTPLAIGLVVSLDLFTK